MIAKPTMRHWRALVLFWLFASGPAVAAEDAYLSRFIGSWSGSGTVEISPASSWPVICTATGQLLASNHITVEGTCRVAVIVTRTFSMNIAFQAASGTYSGTYVGALAGPASTSGSRTGDEVSLTMTWPSPVNGSLEAIMSVLNDGKGNMRMTISNRTGTGGAIRTISDIGFTTSS